MHVPCTIMLFFTVQYIFNKKIVLNEIEKFNKDKFNKRGNCKLQYPKIDFVLNQIKDSFKHFSPKEREASHQ